MNNMNSPCRLGRLHAGIPRDRSGNHPDIAMSHHGSIVLFHPLTDAAHNWMREHCPEDSEHLYFAGALVVELRHLENLRACALADGLQLAVL